MRIHLLQHTPFEDPGYIAQWASKNDHEVTTTRLHLSQDLPDVEEIDALIILGGASSLPDVNELPWFSREKQFLVTCIGRRKKVLGICLGAQIIADTFGAKSTTMKEKEIGWFPLQWTEGARAHPLLNFLPEQQQSTLHWHSEQFELPEGALSLAFSEGCLRQGFLLYDFIMGLQFHLEITRGGLQQLIDNNRDDLIQGKFIQQAQTMMDSKHFNSNNRAMGRLLDRFLGSRGR